MRWTYSAANDSKTLELKCLVDFEPAIAGPNCCYLFIG